MGRSKSPGSGTPLARSYFEREQRAIGWIDFYRRHNGVIIPSNILRLILAAGAEYHPVFLLFVTK